MFGQFVWAEPQLRRQSQFLPKFELLAKSYPQPIITERVRRTFFGNRKEYEVRLLTLDAFMKTIDNPANNFLDLDETTVCMRKGDLLSKMDSIEFPDGFGRISFREKARYAYLQTQFKTNTDAQMLWGAFQLIWRGIDEKEPQERSISFTKDGNTIMKMNI